MASTRKTNDHFIAWNRIQKIVLFKQDCITVDQIRALVIIDDESSFELREDLDIGWKDFIHEIPNHLEGCETEDQWFQAVAFPAFELCERTIYERNLNVCP